MIPDKDKHVKILLRNGTLIEGIVEEWFQNHVQLRSTTDKSIMIITHPEEDIMLIKVLPDEETTDEESVPEKEPELPSTDLEAKFQKLHKEPGSAYDLSRNKSLAELRSMVAEQERQIIAKKLRTHYPNQVRRPSYGYPRFFKKPSSE